MCTAAPRSADEDGTLTVIVVGSDALSESVCRKLRAAGAYVSVIGLPARGFRKRVEACGAAFFGYSEHFSDVLRAAGVVGADALLAIDQDDRLNLEMALEAREMNPHVRIVMRQFNRSFASVFDSAVPTAHERVTRDNRAA